MFSVRTGGIYTITNLVTGDFYLGRAKDFKLRKRQHWNDLRKNDHDNRYLQAAWNKYGETSFIFAEEFSYSSEDALTAEQVLLDNQIGTYNLSDSASGVRVGSKATSEWRANISAALKGKKKSAEHCLNLCFAWAENKERRVNRIKQNQSAEQRAALSLALKGRPKSVEHIAKIGKAFTAKRMQKMRVGAMEISSIRRIHSALHFGIV